MAIIFKTVISLLAVYFICHLLGATLFEQCWALLTVFVIISTRLGSTLYASFYRGLGTFLGGILALLLLMLLPTNYWWSIPVGLVVIGISCSKIVEQYQSLRIIGATAVFVFLLGIGVPDPWRLSLQRLGYVLLSILITFFISLIFFPKTSSRILSERIAVTMQKNAEILTELLKSYCHGLPLEKRSLTELNELKQRLDNSRILLNEMKLELLRKSKKSSALLLLKFVNSQEKIYNNLLNIAEIVNKGNGKEISEYMHDSLLHIASSIQATFLAMATYINKPDIMFERYVLTNAIKKLEEELTNARTHKFFAHFSNDVVMGLFALIFSLELIASELITIKKIIMDKQ